MSRVLPPKRTLSAFGLIALMILMHPGATIAMSTPDPLVQPTEMQEYHIGRFAVKVPAGMTLDHQGTRLRFREIEEVVWPQGQDLEKAREAIWQARLAEIAQKKPPKDKEKVIIETRDLSIEQRWMKAVLYYGSDDYGDMLYWDVLSDGGSAGAWIKNRGVESAKEKMLVYSLKIAKAYRIPSPNTPTTALENGCYLQHGAIALPYLEDEEVYARFNYRPLNIGLKIQTQAVDVIEKVGLLDKLSAILLSGFAEGVKIKKLRTGKRTVAGFKGEESIVHVTEDGDSELSFTWTYPGQPDSGDEPDMTIDMSTVDAENYQEKLAIWDAILDTIRPIGR